MTAPYLPALRSRFRLGTDGLVDELLARTLKLDGPLAALSARLDGATPWSEIRAGLVEAGQDEDEVDAALRALYCLYAVEGAGDELTVRLEQAVKAPEQAPTQVLAGARFSCQGSGGCCSGYSFGPLSDEDLVRLDGLDLAGAFPHRAPPYVEHNDEGRFLRRDGDRCIFLEGDQRCGIHRRFGAAAKPHFCQLYPIEAFGTVEGVRVADRGTCATFGTSARTGLPLFDDAARVRTLWGRAGLHHPLAVVDGTSWDHGLYLRFTGAASALVERGHGDAIQTLHALGRMLDGLSTEVSRCPLEPGQPDDTVTRVLAAAADTWYQPAELYPGFRGVRTLGTFLRELSEEVEDALARGKALAAENRFRAFAALIEQTADAIAYYDGTGVAEEAFAPDVEEALRLSIRQQLFGRQALAGGQAGAGLVRIGLIQLCALSAARQDAGLRPLTAADLSRGHMLATRALHSNVTDVLITRAEARWRQMLDGLSVACRLVAAVQPVEP